jgi:hypothetical protein
MFFVTVTQVIPRSMFGNDCRHKVSVWHASQLHSSFVSDTDTGRDRKCRSSINPVAMTGVIARLILVWGSEMASGAKAFLCAYTAILRSCNHRGGPDEDRERPRPPDRATGQLNEPFPAEAVCADGVVKVAACRACVWPKTLAARLRDLPCQPVESQALNSFRSSDPVGPAVRRYPAVIASDSSPAGGRFRARRR